MCIRLCYERHLAFKGLFQMPEMVINLIHVCWCFVFDKVVRASGKKLLIISRSSFCFRGSSQQKVKTHDVMMSNGIRNVFFLRSWRCQRINKYIFLDKALVAFLLHLEWVVQNLMLQWKQVMETPKFHKTSQVFRSFNIKVYHKNSMETPFPTNMSMDVNNRQSFNQLILTHKAS